MDIDQALSFTAENHHTVLCTYNADGTAQLTPVDCVSAGDGTIVISSRETAYKVRNLRRDPRVILCVFTDRFYGEWIAIEGPATIVSLPEAMEGLVDYYRRAAGEHPDWDDYRNAMVRDRRVLIKVKPERVGPTRSG